MTQGPTKDLIKSLKQSGADLVNLIEVYVKQVRTVLKCGVPVWNLNIPKEEELIIEIVQMSFLYIVLGKKYESYENALLVTGLESLKSRRMQLYHKEGWPPCDI